MVKKEKYYGQCGSTLLVSALDPWPLRYDVRVVISLTSVLCLLLQYESGIGRSGSGDANMRLWTRPALVRIMACMSPDDAITQTNVVVLTIEPLGTNFSEIWLKYKHLILKKCIWKYRLQNVGRFAHGDHNVSHYKGVIMGLVASQITSLSIVYSALRGIHRGPWIPCTNGQ